MSLQETLNPDLLHKRLLTALAANREPGFHFPGYFLDLTWPHIGTQSVEQAMDTGPHCVDREGVVIPAALAVVVDGALATAPRLVIEPGARLATVHLDMQYTGHEPRGALNMQAALEGFITGDAVRQSISRGVLTSDGQPVCYATGTFVLLPPPAGVKLGPLPWQRQGVAPPAPLEERALEVGERSVLRTAQAALAATDEEHAFIERFWGIQPKPAAAGATCHVKIGPQIGNRVGHVQGGILLGIAQATASAAVPRHPAISNVSAWYISPGHGKSLSVRSRVLHAGRSFAVVRTEIKNSDGTRVLEAVSNHAARRGAHGT
jgi:acyl-coenzyme A thioesterase PaaI-like protein